jgi:aspartyl-tRNA(Asn)/glutamyl-tRNA(Gln) amidotransferase subunit B
MEEGSMRCDANVSINTPGAGLGRKVEIKNLNSSRFVRLGLDYEIKRQAEVLDKGGTIRQETRLWNENRDQTEIMRSKESSHDYRFFPEPDLPVFEPDAAFTASVDAGLVELPFDRERRLASEYSLSAEQSALACDEREGADWFEAAVAEAVRLGVDKIAAAERVANWMSTEVRRVMNRDGLELSGIGSFRVSSARMASIVAMVAAGRVSNKVARQVFEAVLEEDAEPAAIVAARGWELVVDPGKIAAAVDAAFTAEASTVADTVAAMSQGNEGRIRSLSAFLAGKAIAASGGKAEPGLVRAEVDGRLKTLAAAAV